MTSRTLAIRPLNSLTPPGDSVEHVYSAVEYDTDTGDNEIKIVCYRTADGMTRSAVMIKGGYETRRWVGKFK